MGHIIYTATRTKLVNDQIDKWVITTDFMKESTKDLPNHGYDASLPTCWILEGLVMYMQKPEVIQLLTELTGLSAKGSYIILNFFNGGGGAGTLDYMGSLLKEKGWSNEQIFTY